MFFISVYSPAEVWRVCVWVTSKYVPELRERAGLVHQGFELRAIVSWRWRGPIKDHGAGIARSKLLLTTTGSQSFNILLILFS